MKSLTLVQILDEVLCISFHANVLGIHINLSFLHFQFVVNSWADYILHDNLYEKEKSDVKPAVISLKYDLGSYPGPGEDFK